MELTPSRVREAGEWSAMQWSALPDQRWSSTGPNGSWSPRRTLDHLVDTLFLYSAYVARRAVGRLLVPRNGDPAATTDGLLDALASGTAVLTRLLEDLGDHERAFHPSGMADRAGWVAMACTELLVHTDDACRPPGGRPPTQLDDLADDVVDRVFPWAPPEGNGWDRLLWSTGRAPLGGHEPPEADWWWQSAPLSEWDGTPHRRSTPPQW
jgi:hypothetical protein